MRARQSRHGDDRRVRAGRRRPIPRRSPISPTSSTPTSWWSVPRIRSSPASSTRCRPPGSLAFGPTRPRRELEGSKAWMKDVLVAAGVPTARHATFAAGDEAARGRVPRHARRALRREDRRARGRQGCARHRVVGEARDAVRAYLSGAAFGDAGRTCVIEEGLDRSRALGVRAVRRHAAPRWSPCAQDHKRAFDGDTGPEHRRHGRVLAGAVRRNRRSSTK